MSRTNSSKCQAVAVIRVHVGLNFEDKTRERTFKNPFILYDIKPRQRRGSKFGNCVKQSTNTKVGQRRPDEDAPQRPWDADAAPAEAPVSLPLVIPNADALLASNVAAMRRQVEARDAIAATVAELAASMRDVMAEEEDDVLVLLMDT
jgi:hypothetical protein